MSPAYETGLGEIRDIWEASDRSEASQKPLSSPQPFPLLSPQSNLSPNAALFLPKYFSNPLLLSYSIQCLHILNISYPKHSKSPKSAFLPLVLTSNSEREIFLEYTYNQDTS